MIRRILNWLGLVTPFGTSVFTVMGVLKNNTHCGKYWNQLPWWNPLTRKVGIGMEADEFFKFNMRTGLGHYTDDDYDGCCLLPKWDFHIAKGKKGNLTILRIKGTTTY